MDSKHLTFEQKVGQLIMAGIPEEQPSDEFWKMAEKYQIGNIILFARNLKSREQTWRMNTELKNRIQEQTGWIPLISIDEEGGVVSRMPGDCAVMPSVMAQVSLKNRRRMYEAANIVGRQLRDMEINVNLSPVLDLNYNQDNPMIGVRSYGETIQEVLCYGQAGFEGYRDAGVLCVGKHFPGYGETRADAHLAMARVDTPKEVLMQREIRVFSEMINNGLPAIMTGHVVVPSLDASGHPCTMSEKMVQGLLRETLSFDGLLVSDALEMEAIREIYGVGKGAVEALKAGVDMLLVCHSLQEVESVVQAVYQAVRQKEISMERIDNAVNHVLAAKRFVMGSTAGRISDEEWKQQISFAKQFYEDTIHPIEGEKFCLGETPVFVGARPACVTQVSEDDDKDFATYMQKNFGGTAISFSLDPDEKERQEICKAVQGKSALVLATLNGHLYKGQTALMHDLEKEGLPMALVALRNPYDLKYVSEKVFKLPLYEYSMRTLPEAKKYFVKQSV